MERKLTDEYCARETELTSHLDSYLTGEMTSAGCHLSHIQEMMSSNRAVSIELSILCR